MPRKRNLSFLTGGQVTDGAPLGQHAEKLVFMASNRENKAPRLNPTTDRRKS
jgi:hypothetical protein